MRILKEHFGKTGRGEDVEAYTLVGPQISARVLSYGGILQMLSPFGRDVVLGFDTVSGYEAQDKYIGAVVGRVAGRIGSGHFTADGIPCTVSVNNGPHCLHGGITGFNQKIWEASVKGNALCLTLESPDGDEGFPGRLQVQVTYRLTPENGLQITYQAETTRITPVSLTNHSYFNLNGQGVSDYKWPGTQGKNTILNHTLQIPAQTVLENDETSLPTGKRFQVKGTPFDFTRAKTLGADIGVVDEQLRRGRGYDHTYLIHEKSTAPLSRFATLAVPDLTMDALTTQPGFQLYSGNWLAGEQGKGKIPYIPRSGVALEAQGWPDAVNHPDFPSVWLTPGSRYEQTTEYRFRR